MSKQTRLEITIGVFVIAGALAVAGMILAFGGGSNIFTKSFKVKINFDRVGDLLEGAPVKMGGVKVGYIKKISLLKTGKVEAIAAIFEDDSPGALRLKKDTTALVKTAGIVGDSFVELIQGESLDELPRDGTAVITQGGGDLMSNIEVISTKAIATIDKVNAAVDNLNGIIGDQAFRDNIHATVASAANIAKKTEEIAGDLKGTTANIYAMTGEKNLNAVNEIIENARKSSADITDISSNLSTIFARTNKLFADKEPILRASFDNVSAITADIREKLAAIKPDQGLMRYLTTDEFNRRLDAIMDQVNAITTSLGEMFEGTTKLELMKAYVGGRRMWGREEKELRRMHLNDVVEMENEIWRRDREKYAERKAIIAGEKK